MEAEEPEGIEEVEHGVTKAQGKGAIILLAILAGATVLQLLGSWLSWTDWEYRIEGTRDEQWQTEMAALGRAGWELASARRAVHGEGVSSVGLYECIFKRPKMWWRASPKKLTAQDAVLEQIDRGYERSQEGR